MRSMAKMKNGQKKKPPKSSTFWGLKSINEKLWLFIQALLKRQNLPFGCLCEPFLTFFCLKWWLVKG